MLALASAPLVDVLARASHGDWFIYAPDSHHGSLKAPIVLKPCDDNRPYKIIENNHIIIIRNNEKYGIDGKKLQ